MITSNNFTVPAGTTTLTQPQPPQQVCPHCGYCPHCGRGGWYSQPIWRYIPPYWYTNTTGTVVTSPVTYTTT